MFKGKVHLYKNINGKEEEVRKEFDNEKEFSSFIESNPELKKLNALKWEPIKWPTLSSFDNLFSEAKKLGDKSIVKEMEQGFSKFEKEMKSLFDKSKKLIGK